MATLRRKSREFALQMLFEWDMTRRKPAQVEENFWKQASASDTTQQFADQLFEGAIAHAEASDKVIEKLHRMYEEFGFQNVILSINMGGDIDQRDVLRTYELIADKVIPAVRHLGADVPSSVSA